MRHFIFLLIIFSNLLFVSSNEEIPTFLYIDWKDSNLFYYKKPQELIYIWSKEVEDMLSMGIDEEIGTNELLQEKFHVEFSRNMIRE